EKNSNDRYPTALALAEDLRRFLNREPVNVRPVGFLESGVKWIRRRPTLAAAYFLAIFATVLLVVGGGMTYLWWQAAQARDTANSNRRDAESARDEVAMQKEQVERAFSSETSAKTAAESARGEAVAARRQLE